jgi:hypothetical protein
VAIIIPHPVPQNLHTDLSHRHPASVCFATAFSSSGTAMPTAVAALTAAVVFRNCLLDTFITDLLFQSMISIFIILAIYYCKIIIFICKCDVNVCKEKVNPW